MAKSESAKYITQAAKKISESELGEHYIFGADFTNVIDKDRDEATGYTLDQFFKSYLDFLKTYPFTAVAGQEPENNHVEIWIDTSGTNQDGYPTFILFDSVETPTAEELEGVLGNKTYNDLVGEDYQVLYNEDRRRIILNGTVNQVADWDFFPIEEQNVYYPAIQLSLPIGYVVQTSTLQKKEKNIEVEDEEPLVLFLAMKKEEPTRVLKIYKSMQDAIDDNNPTEYKVDGRQLIFNPIKE